MQRFKKFTNTDTGQFRAALHAAGLKSSADNGTVYNDLNNVTNKRRLKLECWWSSSEVRNAGKVKLKALEQKLRETFGKRFVSADLAPDMTGYILRLDDNLGQPFKIPPSSRRRKVYPPYVAPARLTLSVKQAFWRTVSDINPNKADKIAHQGTIVTLNQDILVYKKVYTHGVRHVIANLVIPAGSRVHVTASKCRADKADVASMFYKNGNKDEVQVARSGWRADVKYITGQRIKPDFFGNVSDGMCSGGIHFYVDINQALDH